LKTREEKKGRQSPSRLRHRRIPGPICTRFPLWTGGLWFAPERTGRFFARPVVTPTPRPAETHRPGHPVPVRDTCRADGRIREKRAVEIAGHVAPSTERNKTADLSKELSIRRHPQRQRDRRQFPGAVCEAMRLCEDKHDPNPTLCRAHVGSETL